MGLALHDLALDAIREAAARSFEEGECFGVVAPRGPR
jgi:hypothetical protein